MKNCLVIEFKGETYTRNFHNIQYTIHPSGVLTTIGWEDDPNNPPLQYHWNNWSNVRLLTTKECGCENDL